MAQVRIDQRQLKALLSGRDGPVYQDIMQRGNRVLAEAVRICPTDEGRLRNSLKMEMRLEDGVPVARIGSNLPYALYVHEGTGLWSKTRPGPIRPVNARVLRWPKRNNSGSGRRRYTGGKTSRYVFAKKSAGSPPRPFLRDALPAGLR